MKKISTLTVIMISTALIIGAGCITDTEIGNKARSYTVAWADAPPVDHTAIETKLSRQIAPYSGAAYDNVTVSVFEKDDAMHLRVSATSSACRYPDLYDFTYQNRELVRTGYLLEAIPEITRHDAVEIAMQNPEIAGALPGGSGVPTVKRILPETSEKFYATKTLLSVTWADASVSALVDMDTGSVVETWGVGG
uniref:PepSY domain-containing protein n=1 Tax=Candidatus Methanogaster sp. ANME-2c ERB4 TaxID=2759911 RepID=A0A7G9YCY9_9EURY|nr:hypothetical protein GMLOODHH_00003 [Methanosarcinales archaeon ANME-2c ERB4]